VKKIERRTYNEASGLRQPRPTRAANGLDSLEERGRPTRPAHKVTRLNDFIGLGALLRNFFAATPARSNAPKSGAVNFGLGSAGKRPKRKLISPSETKRFAGIT
jgi:hypothetical protein